MVSAMKDTSGIAGAQGADRITVIRNRSSGKGNTSSDVVEAAMRRLGGQARLVEVAPKDDLAARAREEAQSGADIVVAAGGDGTIMAVANGLAGTGAAMAVLPLGTFNYFARGLDLPEDPVEAAETILSGRRQRISLGAVADRVFLNNVSIGIYPAILKERETVYRAWGRSRLAAYWSVLKTFARAQRPLRIDLEVDGESHTYVTPLVFVARSAFQLEHFNLPGSEAVADDKLVIFVGTRRGRWGLVLQAWHLVRRSMKEGRDFDVLTGTRLVATTRRRQVLVACDGEKFRVPSPVEIEMRPDILDVIVPGTA